MRIAPLGAYFADDLDRVVAEATASAVVTHTHPEAAAGAIAIAAAAALAWQQRATAPASDWRHFIDAIVPAVPTSSTRDNIVMARDLPDNLDVEAVIARIGNGSGISAQDTVPFVLWCAAHHLYDFEAAIWLMLSGFGDIDTNAAMVGGIVALATGSDGIPATWRAVREELPSWLPVEKDEQAQLAPENVSNQADDQ